MKTKNEKDTTTVALSISDNQRLTDFCKAHSIPKKDFIGIILNYLEINGINPKTHHAPKTELEKISKRINQLFAFIRTNEKDYTRPALEAVLATENRLQQSINQLTFKDDIVNLSTISSLNKLLELIKQSNQVESDKVLAELEKFRSSVEIEFEELKRKKKGLFK